MFFRIITFLFLLVVSLSFIACQPSHRELLNRADQKLLEQKAQLAKYLYLQIIKEHKRKDDIRFRALKGLAEVSLTQVFEYSNAVVTMERIVKEYESDPVFRSEIPEWRKRLAEVYRVNLESPRKAGEVLEPLAGRSDLSIDLYQELARTAMALGEFEKAESNLHRVWDFAIDKKDCTLMREAQMDLVQSFALRKNCQKAYEWIHQKLPEGCKTDTFGLALEKAHCLELSGDISGAFKLYEEIIAHNPQNMRAQFLLEALKKREREKKLR